MQEEKQQPLADEVAPMMPAPKSGSFTDSVPESLAPPPTRPDPPLPTIGRIVHYVPQDEKDPAASNYAKVVPGIVVSTHGATTVNLQVFIDGEKGVAWKTSVLYSDNKEPGTWH